MISAVVAVASASSIAKTKTANAETIVVDFELTDTIKRAKTKIYKVDEVDEKPEFIGGEKEMMKFIVENTRYAEDTCMDVTGRIHFGFVVEKDGRISNIKIIRPIVDRCDAELLRVVKTMPKWKAGKKDGKPVRVYCTISVMIQLI